jgi:hypothetical protein
VTLKERKRTLGATLRIVSVGLGPLAIAVATCSLAYCTWDTWPDVVVDFGRELYVPWQLASGKVLYKDIAIFHGPLSQCLNSVWFRVFGVSFRTLVICNLTILGLLITLLYLLLRQVANRWPAVAACLTFVFLFAFAQYIPMGNFNYVCPYAHEMIHGLFLSLASLACMWRYERWGVASAVSAGLALGLAFLTKPEVFVPGLAADLTVLALTMSCTRPSWGRLCVVMIAFFAAVVVPIAVAVAWLSAAMPVTQALQGAFASWMALLQTSPAGQKYFQTVMGVDDIPGNLGLLAKSACQYAAIVIPACILGLVFRFTSGGRGVKEESYVAADPASPFPPCLSSHALWGPILSIAAFVVVGALLWPEPFSSSWPQAIRPLLLRPSPSSLGWFEALRPLPLFMLAAAAVLLVIFIRCRRKSPSSTRSGHVTARPDRLIRQLSLVIFALGLLGKILLNARVTHYGFVLAMPATLVLVIALLDWVPTAITRLGGYGGILRAATLAGLMICILSHLSVRMLFAGSNNVYPVARGGDRFLADARGPFVSEALRWLANYSRRDETLAVFPEGVMLNYLSRRANPMPYLFFTPFDLGLFGEDRIRKSLAANPPAFVALVHKTNSEYGTPFFGKDYGKTLNDWIHENYREVYQIGDRPLEEGSRFGILLLRNKTPASRLLKR